MAISRVRTSAVVVHNNQILTFFAKDPYDQREFYFLPGGGIDPGETAPEAAVRETLEETGYEISIAEGTGIDKEYSFHWNNEDYDCLTIFYRGYLLGPFQTLKPVVDAPYNLGVKWIPVAKVPEVFAYTEEIRDAILELIETHE